ncbi:hypothetical protein SFUMM280S_00920 [Streptomyces fumanus]
MRKEADAKLADANRELDAAREARRIAEKRAASLKRTRDRGEVIKQGSIWIALAAVIALTASGEGAFARMVGLGSTPFGDLGWAMPVGLDVYAVTAFRMRKDVPYALGLMAATNITYHVADMTGTGVTVVDGKQHPSVGLIGLAATLAIALAALRGTATALTEWRQRRQERAEELAPLREARLKHRLAGEEAAAKHALAMQSIGDKAQQRGKSIPSSQDFGRKSLGGGRGSLMGGGGKGGGTGGSKGAGGTGPGRSGKGGSGSGLTPGGKKTSPPKTSTGLGSVGGKGKGKGGSKTPGSGRTAVREERQKSSRDSPLSSWKAPTRCGKSPKNRATW